MDATSLVALPEHLVNGPAIANVPEDPPFAGDALARLQGLKQRRADQIRNYFNRDLVDITRVPGLKRLTSPFLNSKSEKFFINGSTLPDVDFDVGTSFAGVLPISDHPDESRQLYFWFFPSSKEAANNEITIWLQGGPGAASTEGLLLENGPFLWQPGTARPTRNTFAWNNLTNMVWIDQPVGTGFSVGTPNITNEYQLADQFIDFFKNFVDTFDMHGYKVYLTGESYAGYYIPYIANGFIDANDTDHYNSKGAAINDPVIGNEIVEFEGVAMQYLNTWSQVFGLDPATMAELSALNEKCGYDKYLDQYFTFPPPPAPFPGPFGNANFGTNAPDDCFIQSKILDAVTALNPCFNFDHIFDTCPVLYNPLGVGIFDVPFNPPGPKVYYNRPDVREAIHAPVGVTWLLSATQNVFVGKPDEWTVALADDSLPPAQIGIVSKMIEATNNVIVGAGGLDFQLPANGTLLVFKNMTWNGGQGFSSFPNRTLFVPHHPVSNNGSLSGHGVMGSWTEERGLTFYISHFAGHEDPWYTPGVAFRVLQTLLGRISDLNTTGSF